MHRRDFLTVSAAAGLASNAAATPPPMSQQFFELNFYRLRNSQAGQSRRLAEFFEKQHLPMCQRHEIGPAGYFQVDVGPDMPTVISVTAYDSWAGLGAKQAAQQADQAWTKALEQFGSAAEPAYDRMESWLLKAFEGAPKLEAPEVKAGQAPRLFDLRTYESETERDAAEKIRMFNEGEIEIFRSCGIHPVFFGQTVYGSRMPNLTYLVWYDDWTARDAAWSKFRDDPAWKKLSSRPGWSNADIVSSITHRFLRPLPFSPIR